MGAEVRKGGRARDYKRQSTHCPPASSPGLREMHCDSYGRWFPQKSKAGSRSTHHTTTGQQRFRTLHCPTLFYHGDGKIESITTLNLRCDCRESNRWRFYYCVTQDFGICLLLHRPTMATKKRLSPQLLVRIVRTMNSMDPPRLPPSRDPRSSASALVTNKHVSSHVQATSWASRRPHVQLGSSSYCAEALRSAGVPTLYQPSRTLRETRF